MCHQLQLMGFYNQEDRRKDWSCLQVVAFVLLSSEQNHVSVGDTFDIQQLRVKGFQGLSRRSNQSWTIFPI